VTQLLEGFGEFITPKLFSMYRTVISKEWRTLDLVENTESVIHTVVRSRGGTPPVLSVERKDATELVVSYGSKRKLCALARGIIRGIAKHYGERVTIAEPQCMHTGAKSCRLEVKLLPASALKNA
jgi:predicted hydrocarbon binding protein